MKKFFAVVGIAAFTAAVAIPAHAGDAAAGKKHYTDQKCDKCHGEGGAGDGKTASLLKLELMNWTDKAAMEKMTDEDLHAIIDKGGKAVGKSPKMPAYGNKLDTKAIDDIVAWIRSLAS